MSYNFDSIKNFLTLNYSELTEKNLEMKEMRKSQRDPGFFQEKVLKYLNDEKKIKAITVCFNDLEGKLQILDYDKHFLIKSYDNLTFDGSSIHGFSAQRESDLLLHIDWSSFYWVPCDLFGSGKVMVFANVYNRAKAQYDSDFRGRLQTFVTNKLKEYDIIFNVAPEIEGFLFEGVDAEQNYSTGNGFKLVTTGGYYSALPQDPLRLFIDAVAEATRAMGFENEKDHPEVAPSQFELNYKYTTPVEACDQIQLYKLLCRQVAKKMGCTSSFLPKPLMSVNGSGMHLNISASSGGQNLFYSDDGLSETGKQFATSVLNSAKDICLILNSSVNSYRRLDPKFEAPNEIKMSDFDRSSMIRIPYGDRNSTRIEIRSVAPDCNPYLTIFTLLNIGTEDSNKKHQNTLQTLDKYEKLPGDIYEAIDYFKNSSVVKKILGEEVHAKYCALKEEVAGRSPRNLGNIVKNEEIIYHHEITNQFLWNIF